MFLNMDLYIKHDSQMFFINDVFGAIFGLFFELFAQKKNCVWGTLGQGRKISKIPKNQFFFDFFKLDNYFFIISQHCASLGQRKLSQETANKKIIFYLNNAQGTCKLQLQITHKISLKNVLEPFFYVRTRIQNTGPQYYTKQKHNQNKNLII